MGDNKNKDVKNTIKISECKDYVEKLLSERLPDYIHFHDWLHTKQVAKEAKKIAKELKLPKELREELIIAALFHDTGYTESLEAHEEVSMRIAQKYLNERGYPPQRIQNVIRLIGVTKENVSPVTQVEKIMVDAANSHLGKKNYQNDLRDLMAERLQIEEGKIVEIEWHQANFELLNSHQYQTKIARKLYYETKEKNLKKLRTQLKELDRKNSITENKAARMIFKTALRNHIDLTSIADNKANIMLSINAVILTLGMPLFATYFVGRPSLMIPAIVFLATCLITMIVATIATRPVKIDGSTDLNNLLSGKSNLFFFGNFYNLKLEEYHGAIDKIVSDKKTLERSIVNDLYFLGQALGTKYNMLRICYTVFASGLIITFLTFVFTYFFFDY